MLQYESRNSSMKGSASKVLRNCKIIFLVILKEEYTMIKDFFLNPEVITLIEKEYNKKIESNTGTKTKLWKYGTNTFIQSSISKAKNERIKVTVKLHTMNKKDNEVNIEVFQNYYEQIKEIFEEIANNVDGAKYTPKDTKIQHDLTCECSSSIEDICYWVGKFGRLIRERICDEFLEKELKNH